MTFETTYLLEKFRAIQPELFDESGKSYRDRISEEMMLMLINQLEQKVISLQTKLTETYL
jgi:hypothetical protein